MRSLERHEDFLSSTVIFHWCLKRPFHSLLDDILGLSLYDSPKLAEETLERKYVVIYCELLIKRSWLLTSPPCVQIFVCMQFLMVLGSAVTSLDHITEPQLHKRAFK